MTVNVSMCCLLLLVKTFAVTSLVSDHCSQSVSLLPAAAGKDTRSRCDVSDRDCYFANFLPTAFDEGTRCGVLGKPLSMIAMVLTASSLAPRR